MDANNHYLAYCVGRASTFARDESLLMGLAAWVWQSF